MKRLSDESLSEEISRLESKERSNDEDFYLLAMKELRDIYWAIPQEVENDSPNGKDFMHHRCDGWNACVRSFKAVIEFSGEIDFDECDHERSYITSIMRWKCHKCGSEIDGPQPSECRQSGPSLPQK